MRFCRDQFRAETWVSGTDIAALSAPRRYDLIWVGSVLTHLSAPQARELIDKVLGWLNVGGLLVMSTIGRKAYTLRNEGEHGVHPRAGLDSVSSKGYAEPMATATRIIRNQAGYGLSLISLSLDFGSWSKVCRLRASWCLPRASGTTFTTSSRSNRSRRRRSPEFRSGPAAHQDPPPLALDWSRTALASQPKLCQEPSEPIRSALRWVRQTRKVLRRHSQRSAGMVTGQRQPPQPREHR